VPHIRSLRETPAVTGMPDDSGGVHAVPGATGGSSVL
jgi:hypothetical protein